jgi:hypothetical protein
MLQGRLNVDTKYFYPRDNLFILSSRGNEGVMGAYMRDNDCSKYAISHTILTAYRYDPILDSATNQVIGTRIVLISTTDHRGSMPKWIIEKFSPKGIAEFMEKFLAYMGKLQ